MILVGELEFSDNMMAPDGNTGFLWVGSGYRKTDGTDSYQYNISPYNNNAWVGDNFISGTCLTVSEFLQSIVDQDIEFARGVIKKFDDNVGIRLKGMCSWITRSELSKLKNYDKDK